MSLIEPETERLKLRQWRFSDFASFAELNADPRVMQFFPETLARQSSDKMAKRCHQLINENGWGFWAVELKSSQEFIGFVGLNRPQVELPFSPCVEVGWRLHYRFWHKGYATEAGRAAINMAFEKLLLERVVSFTARINSPSRRVMERLGMQNTNQNFKHPAVPQGHDLEEHVLYEMTRKNWL